MNAIHKNRLLKLATFLEKLPRKKFDFGYIVKGVDTPRKELDCGSAACAIGWCPAVFPRMVEYYEGFGLAPDLKIFVRLKGEAFGSMSAVAERLFGMDYNETDALFDPRDGTETRKQLGLSETWKSATPKAVAKNIRRFVALKSKKT